MIVGPCQEANNDASVTQKVTATTLGILKNKRGASVPFSQGSANTIQFQYPNGILSHPRNHANSRDSRLGGIA
uniref:Uncharacterized protein n=1 Tax=Oryza brachyantha TaxID=4533 RepID=J3L8H1_ORYBR